MPRALRCWDSSLGAKVRLEASSSAVGLQFNLVLLDEKDAQTYFPPSKFQFKIECDILIICNLIQY